MYIFIVGLLFSLAYIPCQTIAEVSNGLKYMPLKTLQTITFEPLKPVYLTCL